MKNQVFYRGDTVYVTDKIDGSRVMATVKGIEKDEYIPGLSYLYLVATEDSLNDKDEPHIGRYWEIINSSSPLIQLICRATD